MTYNLSRVTDYSKLVKNLEEYPNNKIENADNLKSPFFDILKFFREKLMLDRNNINTTMYFYFNSGKDGFKWSSDEESIVIIVNYGDMDVYSIDSDKILLNNGEAVIRRVENNKETEIFIPKDSKRNIIINNQRIYKPKSNNFKRCTLIFQIKKMM